MRSMLFFILEGGVAGKNSLIKNSVDSNFIANFWQVMDPPSERQMYRVLM